MLFLILKKLGYQWADHLYHLSYGMVDLPSGKMKSREGTVVDADDLISDMTKTAKKISEELGKIDDFSEKEKEYFKTFNKGRITQIETNQITNRASDWYPIETNIQSSNNLLNYVSILISYLDYWILWALQDLNL